MDSDEKARIVIERAVRNAARDLSPLASTHSVVGTANVVVTVVIPRAAR